MTSAYEHPTLRLVRTLPYACTPHALRNYLPWKSPPLSLCASDSAQSIAAPTYQWCNPCHCTREFRQIDETFRMATNANDRTSNKVRTRFPLCCANVLTLLHTVTLRWFNTDLWRYTGLVLNYKWYLQQTFHANPDAEQSCNISMRITIFAHSGSKHQQSWRTNWTHYWQKSTTWSPRSLRRRYIVFVSVHACMYDGRKCLADRVAGLVGREM